MSPGQCEARHDTGTLKVPRKICRYTPVANNRLIYLTAADWAILNIKVKKRSYRLGEEIIQEGAKGDRICILRQGKASVEVAKTGKRAILATLNPGDIFGDMAFLERSVATAAVIARDPEVQTDEILAVDLRRIFESSPGLAYRFCFSLATVLSSRLRETSKALAIEMIVADRQPAVAANHSAQEEAEPKPSANRLARAAVIGKS